MRKRWMMAILVLFAAQTAVGDKTAENVTLRADRYWTINGLESGKFNILLHPGVTYRDGVFTAVEVFPRDPKTRDRLFREQGVIGYIQPVWINRAGRVVFRGDPIHIPVAFNEPRYLDNPEPLHSPKCFPIPLVRSETGEVCPLVLLFPHDLVCLDMFLHVTEKQRLPIQTVDGAVLDEKILLFGLGSGNNLLHLWDPVKKKIAQSGFSTDRFLQELRDLKESNETYSDLNLEPVTRLLTRTPEAVKKDLDQIMETYHKNLERTPMEQARSLRLRMEYQRNRVRHPAFLQAKVLTVKHQVYVVTAYPLLLLKYDWDAREIRKSIPAGTLPQAHLPRIGSLHPVAFFFYHGQPTAWFLLTRPLTLGELTILSPNLARKVKRDNPDLEPGEVVSFDSHLLGVGFGNHEVTTVYQVDYPPANPELIISDAIFLHRGTIFLVYAKKDPRMLGFLALHD